MSTLSTEPFFIPGEATGCLLIHGFGGSPTETQGLGQHLADCGYAVYGVRLAGHGSDPGAFFASRWPEWTASVEQGFDYLRPRCKRVVVVGFSLGGVLGLLLSQERSFDGLVTMGSRVLVGRHWRFRWAPVLRYALAWRDPSIVALNELRKAVCAANAVLPKVQVPSLVMHGRNDTIVSAENAELIVGQLGSATKELVWWDNTGHQMLVEGPHRQRVYERISAFVAQIAAGAEERSSL